MIFPHFGFGFYKNFDTFINVFATAVLEGDMIGFVTEFLNHILRTKIKHKIA